MRAALLAPRPQVEDLLAHFAPEVALSSYEALPGWWRAIA
jgi:hypothetical protein